MQAFACNYLQKNETAKKEGSKNTELTAKIFLAVYLFLMSTMQTRSQTGSLPTSPNTPKVLGYSYRCNVEGCSMVYSTQDELTAHLANHDFDDDDENEYHETEDEMEEQQPKKEEEDPWFGQTDERLKFLENSLVNIQQTLEGINLNMSKINKKMNKIDNVKPVKTVKTETNVFSTPTGNKPTASDKSYSFNESSAKTDKSNASNTSFASTATIVNQDGHRYVKREIEQGENGNGVPVGIFTLRSPYEGDIDVPVYVVGGEKVYYSPNKKGTPTERPLTQPQMKRMRDIPEDLKVKFTIQKGKEN